jgi:hypothetical protein
VYIPPQHKKWRGRLNFCFLSAYGTDTAFTFERKEGTSSSHMQASQNELSALRALNAFPGDESSSLLLSRLPMQKTYFSHQC